MTSRWNSWNPEQERINTWIDNFSTVEQQQLYEQTQAWAEILRESTIDSSLSTTDTKSDLYVQQKWLEYKRDIHTLIWFLSTLEELLQIIENTESWITKKWLSKAWKKTMNEAKTKLKQYKKQLNAKKNALIKQDRAEIYDNDIANLRNLWQQVNKVREDIWIWQWWDFASSANYLYNSPEIARTSNKHQTDNLEFNQQLQKELEEWIILSIFNWNMQKANDFYIRIAQWQYTAADYQLFIVNRSVLTPSFQRCRIAIPNNPNWWWSIERIQWNSHTSPDYKNLDRWETFQKWWLAWIVDKALSNCNNLTPWQRNTWKSIAVLWGYAAWIFGLYKFFTNKKMWFRGKAWITAAAIFGSQALTWEWPISLFQKLMTWWFSKEELESKFWNAFWDAVDWVQNSWIEDWNNLSWAMYSMMVFNETTKVWEVRTLAAKFKNNPQEWQQFRWNATTKLNRYWKNSAENLNTIFSENFDENKWNNWLNSIGIHDWIDDNKLVYELAGNKTMNTIIINKFLSDNWVKVTENKAKKEEFEQYKKSMNDNNQAIDISILENHKLDRFKQDDEATFTDRSEDKQNREKLNDQVEQLSLDEQTKSNLKNEIQLFYDERPIKNKPNVNDLSLEMDNNLLVLKSHNWEKRKIDLQNKTLKEFGSSGTNSYEIRFTRIKELLDTAYLTNDILARQKNKPIVDTPAFQYKPERKWICFNNAETLSFNFDTRILSTWRGWATSKIESLNNHPNEYADYLSKCWLEENKVNIDSTLYPTVTKLSDTWIIFTNEQEVKDLENWLKWIKESLKFSVSIPNWNPFSITLTKKLEFKAVNWDTKDFSEDISEKFPTLLRTWNKEIFLKMMNDPNNKMRWSVHH